MGFGPVISEAETAIGFVLAHVEDGEFDGGDEPREVPEKARFVVSFEAVVASVDHLEIEEFFPNALSV